MPTLQYGKQSMPPSELKADKKAARKIGPVGMGPRALYMNSFYISRIYYALWTDIKRVYKLVAMTKGGFTGIGAFGSMSYLVVELRDGRTKKCQFKYEKQTDQALAWIEEHHPEIPVRSVAAQKKLDEKQAQESRLARVSFDEDTQREITSLQEAKDYLEKKPELYRSLSAAAGKKRVQQQVPAGKRALVTGIFALSAVLIAAGIPMTMKGHPAGIYMLMFGGAFLLFSCIQGAPGLITGLSKLSFGMYLVHLFFLGPIARWIIAGDVANPSIPVGLAIPAIAALTFLCSAVTTKIISLIPGSRYLVG